jgi:hypothetical protein
MVPVFVEIVAAVLTPLANVPVPPVPEIVILPAPEQEIVFVLSMNIPLFVAAELPPVPLIVIFPLVDETVELAIVKP